MIRTPEKIDFLQLFKSLENEIKALKELKEAIIEETESLKDKKLIAENKLTLVDIERDINAKILLLDNYNDRIDEERERAEAQNQDYHKNSKAIMRKAKAYSQNYNLPKNLREHLKKVLKSRKKTKNIEYNVTFYVAIRNEVKLCENFLINKQYEN